MNQPVTSFVSERNVILHKNFSVDIEVGDQKLKFTVPKGFITDGASIPRFLWAFFTPFEGDTLAAALVHDYLYSQKYPRYLADWVLYNLLVTYNAGRIKAIIYLIVVRLCGGFTKHYAFT
jgi:hypothetical protein